MRHVAFSRDRQRVVTGSDDNTARVWNARDGETIAVLKGHASQVYGVAVSPDGKTIATASADNTARLWNAETGEEIRALKGHGRAVLGVAFSPDGKTVATASADGTVRQWEASTGRELAQLKGHGAGVSSAVYSADGSASVRHRATTRRKDVDHRIRCSADRAERPCQLGAVGGVQSCRQPCGDRLGDRTVRIWDAQTGKEVAPPKLHPVIVRSVAFSPDGHWLLTAVSSELATVSRIFWNHAGAGRSRQVVAAALPEPGPTCAVLPRSGAARMVHCRRRGGTSARRQKLQAAVAVPHGGMDAMARRQAERPPGGDAGRGVTWANSPLR